MFLNTAKSQGRLGKLEKAVVNSGKPLMLTIYTTHTTRAAKEVNHLSVCQPFDPGCPEEEGLEAEQWNEKAQ